jgi:membrane associated rhomboid family serine protease
MNFDLPPVVRYLLIINLIFFGLQALIPVFTDYVCLYYATSDYFHTYQLLTYMFAHGGFGHLLGNMLGLFFFGPLLEQVWGPQRFLIFYLATGIGAAVLYLGIQYYQVWHVQMGVQEYISNPTPNALAHFFKNYAPEFYDGNLRNLEIFGNAPKDPENIRESINLVKTISEQYRSMPGQMLGASGAIFGILIAFATLFPNTEMMLLFFPFPIKAKYFVTMYLAYEVWKLYERNPNDHVAHLAHLGGAAIGFIIVKIWQRNRRTFY